VDVGELQLRGREAHGKAVDRGCERSDMFLATTKILEAIAAGKKPAAPKSRKLEPSLLRRGG